jgi:dolichol-phosphate mannosyltransferase
MRCGSEYTRLRRWVDGKSIIENPPPNGFGFVVRTGLAKFRGDAVAIVMADGSDDPTDLVKYHARPLGGYDCVFGSRFSRQQAD